jgi:hypothetical protein
MSATPVVPLDEFNAKAAAYLQIHRQQPTQPFIANVQTEVDALDAGGVLFPVTINDAEPDNAWVCSPLTTYASYAVEEVERLGHPWVTAPLRLMARGGVGRLTPCGSDRSTAFTTRTGSARYPSADSPWSRVVRSTSLRMSQTCHGSMPT